MPTLRELQIEWNLLVDQAHGLGLHSVRHIRSVHETVAAGERRVAELRRRIEFRRNRLQGTTSLTTTPVVASDGVEFTFGVEVECLMPVGMDRGTLASRIMAAGVSCASEMYNHSTRTSWKVITDGSLGDYTRGCEVVSPVLQGEAGLAQVTKVLDAMRAAGCRVSRKCGLHVHVGARTESVNWFRNLVQLCHHYEGAIDSVMPPSRRGTQNSYCQPVRFGAGLHAASTVDALAAACGQPRPAQQGGRYARDYRRYRKLNLQSFWHHGTVEFRQHQGTVEAQKAVNWVRFCLALAQRARQPLGDLGLRRLPELMDTVSATPDMRTYFQGRVQFFEQRVAA